RILQTIAIPSFSFEFAGRRISRSEFRERLARPVAVQHAPIRCVRGEQSSAKLPTVPIGISQTRPPERAPGIGAERRDCADVARLRRPLWVSFQSTRRGQTPLGTLGSGFAPHRGEA